MKIVNIEKIGKGDVYDITVKNKNSYTLFNGVKSHNTGGMYSSDTVLIVGKRSVKDGKELLGHEFVLKAEKSRFIKEKSAIPVTVLFDGGLDTYSSIFEWACELGYINVPKMGWYTRTNVEGDKNWRRKEIDKNKEEFYAPIINDPAFKKGVENMYKLDGSKTLDTDRLEELMDEVDDEE